MSLLWWTWSGPSVNGVHAARADLSWGGTATVSGRRLPWDAPCVLTAVCSELVICIIIYVVCPHVRVFFDGSVVKKIPAMQEMQAQSPDWEDALEKGMGTHSSILAWIIPWTEEPGGLQSMRSQSQTQLSN